MTAPLRQRYKSGRQPSNAVKTRSASNRSAAYTVASLVAVTLAPHHGARRVSYCASTAAPYWANAGEALIKWKFPRTELRDVADNLQNMTSSRLGLFEQLRFMT